MSGSARQARPRTARLAVAAAGALLAAAVTAKPVPDTIAERTRPCTACHGEQGRATREGFFPRIAGKPAGYLYNQLVHFREGRRANQSMTYLVQYLSDAYLQEIAEHFAALDLPYPPPVPARSAAEATRGEALVRRGDAGRKLPACTECHGEALTGVLPAVPGLLGLPRDYVVGQIGAWRTGQRHAAAPDCMADIARRLTEDEAAAIATWLAAQPLPPSSVPVPSLPRPASMRCGSLAQEAAR